MKPFFVYILACGDGSYYTGHTDDLTVRLRQHEDGGIGYTATRKPFSLKWQGEFETRAAALAFEQQIKGWSRAKKEALMAGDWEQVMTLARGLRQAPLGRGEAQPERGEAPLERGGAPLERGEAPLERGEAPPERRLRPACQPSVHPEPFDVAQDRLVEGPAHARLRQAQPERSGVQPERSGVQPERSGVQPERSGVRPERSGVRPEQSGVRPELSGVRPERSGVRPEQSGVRSEQSGVQPERSGVRPERSGVRPERSGVRPEQSGVRPEQSGVRPELSGVRPEQSGVRSERSGVRPERSGVRPERSGVRPERSEVEPERSGVRPDRSASQTAPQPSVRPEPVEGPAPTAPATEVSPLAIQVLAGHRRAIAKAITLLESTRADHRAQADDLLTALLPHTGKAFRVGISGVPGVGKSTFIEALGLHLIGQGHRVAVLTIDPSSSVSGGSILGDKTRMERLSVDDRAFIRPSPSSGTLGGVAEKTREAMLVCEAAGFDIVIVETVGVGQSETAVANMTDLFVLMQLPNAGDDLQAIKKGVMELADLVVINKADLDPDAATRAQAQITSALRLFTQHGRESSAAPQPVLQLSALRADGVQAFWQAACAWRESRTRSGRLQARRQHQALAWMWERVEASLRHEFRQHPAVQAMLPAITLDVEGGRLAASTAARRLLQARQNDQ